MGYMAWTWCKVRVCCGMRYYIMSCAVLGWVREGNYCNLDSSILCYGGVSERRGRRRRYAIIRDAQSSKRAGEVEQGCTYN